MQFKASRGELSFVSGYLTLQEPKKSWSTTRSSKSILKCSATVRSRNKEGLELTTTPVNLCKLPK